jgi:O-antigen/teichoic acid export membrane protein
LKNNVTLLVAYRALSEVASKVAFFLITLVAARRLTQDGFGVFSLGTTLGWMAAVAADFGIQLHVARAVAQQPARAAMILDSWLRVRLWTASIAVLLVTAGLAVVRPSLETGVALFLFTVVYAVSGLVEFLHYFYRGLERADIESTLTLWQRVGALVCALVALIWWQPVPSALAVGMLAPAVVTFLYSSRWASQLAWTTSATRPPDRAPLETPRAALPAVLPIGAGIVLSALYFRIDVFLVDAWRGTEAVALYNAVFRLVEALRLFPAAVLAVTLPALCRATTRRPLAVVSSLVTGGAIVTSALLWIGAERLVALLFGPSYANAAPAFRILLLAFPLMSLNYALTHQLIGWHGHRAYATATLAALVFNLALNWRLIPSLGIEGAAWTTVWTEVLLTICCGGALLVTRVRPDQSGGRELSPLVDPITPAVSS